MSTPEQAARTLEDLGELLSSTGEVWSEAQLLELGHAALTLMLLRTKSGLDIDRKPFEPYSDAYAAERHQSGLATSPVDLARTGHMLGSFLPQIVEPGSVSVLSMSEFEALKAAAHDRGVDKVVTVRRGGYMGATYLDTRTRRFATRRTIAAGGPSLAVHYSEREDHQRHQRTPQRQFIGVRHPEDLAGLGEMVGTQAKFTVEKFLRERAT